MHRRADSSDGSASTGETHRGNRFSFTPIIEVAVLFAGIFITMIPALLILNANGTRLGVDTPAEFFWASGALSSFLDNAPTYLTFAATAAGMEDILPEGRYLATLLKQPGKLIDPIKVLAAISCGAVFMGANTYIGNGPNFMVKAIADHQKVNTPGFIGYLFKFTLPFMLPVLALVWWLFFRPSG